ncbi:MAG: phenylalanine--tRNA ligase subunit beta [Lentisphaeria bacterium]|nr:phenylalanine--tRNA ligase subunit beta [Lentisphaeria bacterium]
MKISLNWLKEYISFEGDPKALADSLTMAGLEVEEIVERGKIPAGIVVGKILERNPHPNSDHLSICKVDSGKGILQIVCGAPNCDAGKTVPLALEGTSFPDPEGGKPFVIKPCKLRGVESFGMMCSERELGLSEEHGGLMILPDNLPAGMDFSEYVTQDTIYTVEITPNRPDWLSHWGVARDVGALMGGKRRFPDTSVPSVEGWESWGDLVDVRERTLCPHYTARVIRGVKVGESPAWLKERLNAVGIRPINNIVDVTNFVMMELGEPLHAFDSRFLEGKKIVVRKAEEGEKIVALDGKEYTLDNSMLVIADKVKPVAIAGIMGGEYSGVMADTTEIILESAYFQPSSIRATSRKLGLSSDSSYRFERGVDPEMIENASNRAAGLIIKLAGGQLVSELVSVKSRPAERLRIICSFDKIRKLLGMNPTNEEMIDIFRKLGLLVSDVQETNCLVTVPGFRADIRETADLAEEIARIYGLDKLPDIPVQAAKVLPYSADSYAKMEGLRKDFIAAGLNECVNGSFIDEKSALSDPSVAPEDLLKVNNPISPDYAVLRATLLPGMMATIKRNIFQKNTDLAMFEIGHVFCANREKFAEERDDLVVLMTGNRHPERYCAEASEKYDFYDLKGLVESVLEARKVKKVRFEACTDARFAKGCAAKVIIGGKEAGVLGKINDKLTKGMRLTAPLFAAIFQADILLEAETEKILYKDLPTFPSTSRDVAFLAPLTLENATVIDFIRKANVKFLTDVKIFDIFQGEQLGEGKKSMAYSLTFRCDDRTLTDEEVNKEHEKLREKLSASLGVELR